MANPEESAAAPPQNSAGFTLLEVIVATAIFALIVAFTTAIVSHVSRMSREGIGRMQSQFTARSALDFLAAELSQTARPFPGQTEYAPRLRINPPEAGTQAAHPHNLFWQSADRSSTNRYNLTTLGYFVRWNDYRGRPDPVLCRFTDPVVAAETNPPLIYQTNEWLTANRLDELAPATDTNDFRGLFSDRVLALWVRPIDALGLPITRNAAGATNNYRFDSAQGYRDSTGKIFPAPAIPPIMEIALVVADRPALARLDAIPAPIATNPANFYAEIEAFVQSLPPSTRPGARVFTRRVSLLQAP